MRGAGNLKTRMVMVPRVLRDGSLFSQEFPGAFGGKEPCGVGFFLEHEAHTAHEFGAFVTAFDSQIDERGHAVNNVGTSIDIELWGEGLQGMLVLADG